MEIIKTFLSVVWMTGISSIITAAVLSLSLYFKYKKNQNSILVGNKQIQDFIAASTTIAAIAGTTFAAIIIALLC